MVLVQCRFNPINRIIVGQRLTVLKVDAGCFFFFFFISSIIFFERWPDMD